MGDLNWVQWPAMVITVVAAWYVASGQRASRGFGFWCFLASNVLWIIWGIATSAIALVMLQVFLAAINIRGAVKNESDKGG
jgi:hypothetical protein